jgi:hypothetical protein
MLFGFIGTIIGALITALVTYYVAEKNVSLVSQGQEETRQLVQPKMQPLLPANPTGGISKDVPLQSPEIKEKIR